MDAQDFRSLQEAYLEVVENQQLDEAKVDDTMDDWRKTAARDKRHIGRLTPTERRNLDMDVRSGDTTVNQNRQQSHKQSRGKRKPTAKRVFGSGDGGLKYYKMQKLKRYKETSPEEIKKRKGRI